MNELDMPNFLETILTYFEQFFLFLSNNLVVGFFIFLIVVLTILAFISLIRVRWFYQREQTQLNKLEKVLKTLEQQPPLATLGELRNRLRPVFKRRYHTLVYERIQFVLKLAENGKLGRIQAAAEMMPPGNLARQQSYFAHFVISVLLIIGLAGTLWAFEDILTNSGLNSAIQGHEINIKEYTPAIGSIYEGLKSAMLASLAGIIGTIILLYVKFNWIQPAQERFFAHLDWITEMYLIPSCSQFENREQLDGTLHKMTEHLAVLVGSIGPISQDLQNTVKHSHALAEKLNTFTDKTGEVVQWFEQVTNKDSSFYQASTQLFKGLKMMSGNHEQLTKQIEALVTEHNQSVSRYEEYLTHLEETQQTFTYSQRQLAAAVGKIPTEFQEAINGHAGTLQANKRYLEILGELTESLENQQTDYTAQVKNAADKMTASLISINEATAELNLFTTAFKEQAESLIPELAKLGVEPLLHQYVDELKNRLIRTQDEFMANIQQQQEAMQKELNQMDSLHNIEESVTEMHHLLKEHQKSWFSSLFKRG